MLVSPYPCCLGPAALGEAKAPRQQMVSHREGDPGRVEVEAFIRHVYAKRYGADLRSFAPTLVSLRDGGGIVAAAGYRTATQGPLFLERYLDAPIEFLLSEQAEVPPMRSSIVEVGHLAAIRAGGGRRLIRTLAPQLASLGFQWVVSTLTKELRHLLIRIGITPLALGTANPFALGADASHWGSYYDHCPLVLAGHLECALLQLARRQPAAEMPT